ncbi:SRPBCC family protein [Haliangium sp.]|uniref:SRPBCC family protein n=1 Tax=Haliangium sp. TaxID=2663208 RepID=UPI003D138463
MREYRANTTIHQSPEKIWTILLDLARYPEWDPYCDRIEGEVELGNKIKAFSKLSPGRAFPVKVTELVPNQRMTWTGGMPLGLFKGQRTFTLERKGDETEFTLCEVFSGPMLALIGRSLPDLTEPFEKFVAGLKQRAESAS